MVEMLVVVFAIINGTFDSFLSNEENSADSSTLVSNQLYLMLYSGLEDYEVEKSVQRLDDLDR